MLQRLFSRHCLSVCRTSACLKYSNTSQEPASRPRKTNDKRQLWLGFTSDVQITMKQIYDLSADIKYVKLHTKEIGSQCAFLTFKSEEIAEDNFSKLRKLAPPWMEVQYLGAKRYEERDLKRLVYYLDDPDTPKQEILKLSDDISHVHLKPNKVGRSIAFLDFETVELAQKNLVKMLKMNLNVNQIGVKWLRPEDEPKTIFVEFTDIGTTYADVRDLTPDALKFKLRCNSSGQSYAYLVFKTEEVMEENFKVLKQKAGLSYVDYVGDRRLKNIKEAAPRTLWLPFEEGSNKTKDEIRQLSSDIVDIRIKYKAFKPWFAYLQFATEELAKKNLLKFQEMGLKPDFHQFGQKTVDAERTQDKTHDVVKLDELCHEMKLEKPVYEIMNVSRDEVNRKKFLVKVSVGGTDIVTQEEGFSMRLARGAAARTALFKLQHSS